MNLNKKGLALILIIIAFVAFVFSIICFAQDTSFSKGATESNISYGGDAYTGIQNAAAQGATNSYYTNKALEDTANLIKVIGGFFFLLVTAVCGLSALYVIGLIDMILDSVFNKPKAPAVAPVVPVVPAPEAPKAEETAAENE